MGFKAVIFDLDGVITDTAEYHFLAWKQLAGETNLSFSREENEHLRGVSRRDSLLFILSLNDRTVDDATLQQMMARKNDIYVEMLTHITPADLLPGVFQLLNSLDDAHLPFSLGSASKNAIPVLTRLGIKERFQVIADGHTPGQKKPAPDLFLYAASRMGINPKSCLVVEDAASGVQAAQSAGMAVLAIGPANRFGKLLAHSRTFLRQNLEGLTAVDLNTLEE
ncbi:MAG: beta-phosphoglucomutase [Chloroflexota bacterium]